MIPHISFEQALGLVISDTTLAIIVAQIPITVTAIAGLIMSIRNGTKADKIANSVDGTSTKLINDLATANGRIEQLMRFYPTPIPLSRGAEVMPRVVETDDEPAKVEIVQPDDKPVSVETKKKEKT